MVQPAKAPMPAWVIRGTITDFKVKRRYGFIRGDDGKDYFFHVNQCRLGTPGDGFIRGKVLDREPEVGERVYLNAKPAKGGMKPSASPWAFDDVPRQ